MIFDDDEQTSRDDLAHAVKYTEKPSGTRLEKLRWIVKHQQAHPRIENAPGWIYLAGAKPLGALACSAECGSVAGQRFARTGRVDAPEERGSCKGCGLGIIVNAATRTVSHQDPLCEPFKAILARSRGPVSQSLEVRDGDGKLVRTPEGKA